MASLLTALILQAVVPHAEHLACEGLSHDSLARSASDLGQNSSATRTTTRVSDCV